MDSQCLKKTIPQEAHVQLWLKINYVYGHYPDPGFEEFPNFTVLQVRPDQSRSGLELTLTGSWASEKTKQTAKIRHSMHIDLLFVPRDTCCTY